MCHSPPAGPSAVDSVRLWGSVMERGSTFMLDEALLPHRDEDVAALRRLIPLHTPDKESASTVLMALGLTEE